MAAARAETVQFQAVGLDHKTIFCRDLLLQPFDFAILELDDRSTAGAAEMIVMPFVRDIVVLRLRAEVARLGNSGLAEEVERAVDRGQPQMGIFLGKLMVHGFRRDVLLSKERRQDQFSLASQFQLMLGQMLAKHIHFFESFAHGVSFGVKEAH